MKNKTSTIAVAIPQANKEAKAQLKQIYADIQLAEENKAKFVEDSEIILGANQDKERVLEELRGLKSDLEQIKEEKEICQNSLVIGEKELALLNEKTVKSLEKVKSLEIDIVTLKNLHKEEKEKERQEVASIRKEAETANKELKAIQDSKKTALAEIDNETKEKTNILNSKNKEIEVLGLKIDSLNKTIKEKEQKYSKVVEETNYKQSRSNDLDALINENEKKLSKIIDRIGKERKLFDAECAEIAQKNELEYAKKNKELEKREGELSFTEKRLNNKMAEIRNSKKELENLYGRNLKNIIV